MKYPSCVIVEDRVNTVLFRGQALVFDGLVSLKVVELIIRPLAKCTSNSILQKDLLDLKAGPDSLKSS